MIKYIGTSSGRLPGKSVDTPVGLTLIKGPVGAGKTMMMEMLYWLLTGKLKGSRKADSFGRNPGITAVLGKPGEDLIVQKNGKQVSVVNSEISGPADTAAAVERFTGFPSGSLRDCTYATGPSLLALLKSKTVIEDLAIRKLGLSTLETQRGKLVSVVNRLAGAFTEAQRSLQTAEQAVDEVKQDTEDKLETVRQSIAGLTMTDEANRLQAVSDYDTLANSIQTLDAAAADAEVLGLLHREVPADHLLQAASHYYARYVADGGDPSYSPVRGLKNDADLQQCLSGLSQDRRASLFTYLLQRTALDAKRVHVKELLRTGQYASTEQKKWAVDYLAFREMLLRQEKSLVETLSNISMSQTANQASAELQARCDVLKERYETMAYLAGLLDPRSKDSLRQRVLHEWICGIAGRAGFFCNLAFPEMTMFWKDGLVLYNGKDVIPVDEASGGESALAAVCLYLAMSELDPKPPFLVFDDITGPFGQRTPSVTEMLRYASAVVLQRPVIVLTHSVNATGDSVCRL